MSQLNFRISIADVRVLKVAGDVVVCELKSAYEGVDPMIIELPVAAIGGIVGQLERAVAPAKIPVAKTPVAKAPVAPAPARTAEAAPLRRPLAAAAEPRPALPAPRAPEAANSEDFVLTEEELAWLSQPIFDKAA